MLGDITVAENIYIACGYTDMRKSIDGLATLVQQQFQLDPFQPSLFLFCGRRRDRIKCLLWEGDGFVLLYKRLENGSFQWPRDEVDCKPISLNDELIELRKRVKEQDKEIRRLKEENEFLEETSAFFAASRRKSAKNRD